MKGQPGVAGFDPFIIGMVVGVMLPVFKLANP